MTRQNALEISNSASLNSQKPPMFLQKLYRIVSEPSTNHLISWSEAGDSFFVYDHERLAREHLGNWFKHNKFSSFVRQLNMYGFHKIPHLQAGVLKSDAATETYEFAHEHFHRGQEDRLNLIKRKANKDQAGPIPTSITFPALEPPPGNIQAALPAPPQPSQVQPLDMHTIVNGINAIRRHQTTISNELNELRRSNEALWQESAAAQKRHQKQQDTINRIVKFLAGVFGHQAGNVPKDGELTPPPSTSKNGARALPRLMIEDGQRESLGKVAVTEVDDEELSPTFSRDITPLPSTDGFVSMDTPRSGIDVPSPAPIELSSIPPLTEASTMAPPPTNTEPTPPDRALTPSKQLQFDPTFNAALAQLSPSELSALVTVLMNQPLISDPQLQPPGDFSSSSLVAPYHPMTMADYSSLPALSPPPHQLLTSPSQSDPPMPFDPAKNWQATEDIEKDVDLVNTDINSLMQGIGLDPSFLSMDSANVNGNSSGDASSSLYDFLDNFQQQEFNPEEPAATAFLDEMPSPAPSHGSNSHITNSPHMALRDLPSLHQGSGERRGHKRKSDIGAAELYSTSPNTADAEVGKARPKRRKADK